MRWPLDFPVINLRENCVVLCTSKGNLPRDHLENYASKGPEVRSDRGLLTLDHFWSEVVHRADESASTVTTARIRMHRHHVFSEVIGRVAVYVAATSIRLRDLILERWLILFLRIAKIDLHPNKKGIYA